MPTVHVVPLGDAVEHLAPPNPAAEACGWLMIEELPGEDFGSCPCGTRTEPVPADDGSMGWLVTHHSLDGRELTEMSGP